MVYEHRTYIIPAGKMDAILARFRDHTMDLFKKHGIEVVGFWVTDIGERSYGELVYLVVWSDLNAREAGWTAFRNNADWPAARAESDDQCFAAGTAACSGGDLANSTSLPCTSNRDRSGS